MILRRTSEFKDITSIEENSGDFITDFVYSPYNYDAGEFASPMAAAENHIKWLRKQKVSEDIIKEIEERTLERLKHIAEVNNDVKFIKEIINKYDNYLDIEHIKRKI